jgi:hypothetical protein
MPLERAPALLLMPDAQWQVIQGIDEIEGDGDPGLFFQRWPDGAELPG